MKKLIAAALITFLSCLANAETVSNYFPYQKETDNVVFIDKKTQERRSELTYIFTRTQSSDESDFELYRLGKGKHDKYQNITWETNARLKEKEGFLYLLNSYCTAKDSQGNVISRYSKEVDYGKKVIYWRQMDASGNIKKKADFPIKGKTTDDVTLMYFLKTYVANRNTPGYQTCYLLSNEPRLYKVNIKIIGTETLNLPIGKKRAVKLKLTGDMGIIDDILDKYIPHTYVWYEDVPPYEWLQYEGLETSMQSANVIAYVTERNRK